MMMITELSFTTLSTESSFTFRPSSLLLNLKNGKKFLTSEVFALLPALSTCQMTQTHSAN
jgi:hypothetical protein